MSNLDTAPPEGACAAPRTVRTSSSIPVLNPPKAPSGLPWAIRVRRTRPSLIGAWCFVDQYGPASATMDAVRLRPDHCRKENGSAHGDR